MKEAVSIHQRSSLNELYTQQEYFCRELPFQYFSDSLTEFVSILNKHRQIVFCNRPMLQYLHARDVNEIIGKRHGEALRCSHADNTTGGCGTTEYCTMCGANRAIRKSLEGEQTVQECRITTAPEATALDLSVRATPFTYRGEPFTILAVTDTADENRRKVLEKLFFHDIINTVGGLMGYSQLLTDAGTDEVQELAPVIGQLSSDLYDQIVAQQELLRAEHHEMHVIPSLILARPLAETVAQSIRRHAVAIGKTIEVDAAAEDFQCVSDVRILRRVLGNLAKNALEAAPTGTTVRISHRKRGSLRQFTVHNAGMIPRDIQLQIFQRSFSTKGEGRGLGTYSVKLFTEQYLRGTVSFISTMDVGTIFTVDLPDVLDPSEETPTVGAAERKHVTTK